jgi:hypothetical protein
MTASVPFVYRPADKQRPAHVLGLRHRISRLIQSKSV